MIEAEHSILIDAPIDSVWIYVQDIRRWANLFPGCRDCTVIDAHDSRWILKVGAAGLVRTVNVRVHVDQWGGPERVDFSYKLEGDPVEGGGSYIASRKGAHATEVTLKVRVEGSGPVAPLWEVMGKPLIPTLAKSFAHQLKARIEGNAATSRAEDSAPQNAPNQRPAANAKLSLFASLLGRLRSMFGIHER